jgi:predicted RNA methylase
MRPRESNYLPGMEAEARNLELSQWFTDPKLARSVWTWANRYERAASVLEPSAGQGALLTPIYEYPCECREVVAVEIDAAHIDRLEVLAHRGSERAGHQWHVVTGDFLTLYYSRGPVFDLALMNPPYEDGQAEAFILHALRVCRRVVGIFKASILFGQERYRTLWSDVTTTREVRLAARPSFGLGESGGAGGKTDFVVLELVSKPPNEQGYTSWERTVRVETWP